MRYPFIEAITLFHFVKNKRKACAVVSCSIVGILLLLLLTQEIWARRNLGRDQWFLKPMSSPVFS